YGTTMETIPADVPYLPCPEAEQPGSTSGETKKIGVVWGGSPLHRNDENRSIPLELFAEIFQTPNTQFFSLNRDMKAGDAEMLPRLPASGRPPRPPDARR
ncbi:hypothetical protein B4Q13_18940, partial [Lacticaseibacillus rhamnosus]